MVLKYSIASQTPKFKDLLKAHKYKHQNIIKYAELYIYFITNIIII